MRRLCALLALLAAAGCDAPPRQGEEPATPGLPSVVLITLDTTRADHLGFDRPPGARGKTLTPRLDALADGAWVFERALAPASMTPVSHATILTGLEPYHHGLRVLHGTRQNRLAGDKVTLAEILRAAGHAGAAFISAFPAGGRFGLAQGFDVFDEDFLLQSTDTIVSDTGMVSTGPNQRRADATTDLAVAWLESAPERIFLWTHYFDPHDPILLPPLEMLEGIDRSAPIMDVERAVYRREILYMDLQIGRLLDALRASGRFDDTVVIVAADHGQGLGDHAWWTHGLLYDEQIRIPLLIKPPASHPLAGGRRVHFQVRASDILPTILDLLGAPVDRLALDGRSLAPLVAPNAADPGLVAYADALNMTRFVTANDLPDEIQDDMLLMVSDGRWKYIHHVLRPAESELYDLSVDPGELENVLFEEADVVRRLRADLMARNPFPEDFGEEPGEMSEEDRERLESLGYVQ